MTASAASLAFIRLIVHQRAAIVIEANKDYLLESRLQPLARAEGFASIDALADRLRKTTGGALLDKVIDAMTTNETSFFRDLHPFDALRQQILPPLLAARATSKTLRIWSAAASTGQEAYTIAMTIREHFPELAGWAVQILATDINASVIDRARAATFKQLEVNRGLPATYLVKYFERAGVDWRVKSEIRSMVAFQQLNLLHTWPLFAPPDIVFMRNVLIYFDVPTKRAILGRVRGAMRGDGALLLGGAETTVNLDDAFEPVRAAGTVFYRVRTPAKEAKTAHAAQP